MIRLSKPDLGDEELAAATEVLRSGMLVQGEHCARFEIELAEYLGVLSVIVVSSGTAALHLSLIAAGIGPGDAVVVPDFTFPSTANVVELVGARPMFADVDPSSFNLTPASLEKVIAEWNGSENIRAVMPVHQFGCPADMSSIMGIARQHDLVVIEDAACALGTAHDGVRIGGHGDCACFSFHPRKIITTGEGGAVATNDANFARRLRQLRNHGIERRESGLDFVSSGLNYRMTDFQAAIGRVQLGKVEEYIERRRSLQRIYQSRLAPTSIDLPRVIDGHNWQTYMAVLPDEINRDEMIRLFRDKGIEANLGAYAIHELEYYRLKYPRDCARLADSHASRLYHQGLALPLHPCMTDSDVHEVSDALIEITSGAKV